MERAVFVSALAVGVLVFFRPTRTVGRVLLAIWIVVAWPLAWLAQAAGAGVAPASSEDPRLS